MLNQEAAFKLCQHKFFGRMLELKSRYRISYDVLHDAFMDSFMYAYKQTRKQKKNVFVLLWKKLDFRIQELCNVENRQGISYLTNDDDFPCDYCIYAETCKREATKCKRLKKHVHDVKGRQYVLSLLNDWRQLNPITIHEERCEVQRILNLISLTRSRFAVSSMELLKVLEAPINDDKIVNALAANVKKQCKLSKSAVYQHINDLIVEIKNLMEREKRYELCQY